MRVEVGERSPQAGCGAKGSYRSADFRVGNLRDSGNLRDRYGYLSLVPVPFCPAGSNKKHVSIRLDADVVEKFRATGPGWQTRINEAEAGAPLKRADDDYELVSREGPRREESLRVANARANLRPSRETGASGPYIFFFASSRLCVKSNAARPPAPRLELGIRQRRRVRLHHPSRATFDNRDGLGDTKVCVPDAPCPL